ncbi:MAG: DUF6265 family protein [Hyphomonadaceae bacterium]
MTSSRSLPKVAGKLAVGAAALALAACASGPDTSTLGRFGWMYGCWISDDGANQEVWSAPLGGVMFGYAGTMREGRLAFFEQARVDLRTTPATYVVQPDGARAATFIENPAAFAPEDQQSVTFDNPQNEYPQRISYRTEGKDRLAATISRLDGSQPQEFHWARCK